jgi:hypothetical protein
MTETPVTRRDVARNEIDTAIDLFLSHRDPISAHVLTWAAVDVLKDVAARNAINTPSQQFNQWMGNDPAKQHYKSAKKEYNFFKHSDRDPDAHLDEFDVEGTANILMRACMDYNKIYGQMIWSAYMFSQWYLCRNPDQIKVEYRDEMAATSEVLGNPSQCGFKASTGQTLAIIGEGVVRGNLTLKRCPELLET